MATTPITVYDSTGTGTSLSLSSPSPNGKTVYMDPNSTLAAPHTVSIDHSVRAPGMKGSDRHYATATVVVIDSITGEPLNINAKLEWVVPRSTDVTDTIAKKPLFEVMSYFVKFDSTDPDTGRADSIIDGITP